MKILFCTTNKGKLAEVSEFLSPIEVEQLDADIPEIQNFDAKEVVLDKARKAFALARQPVVVEDTGIYFDAYENFPGVYARPAVMSLGIEGMLKLLEGKKREAHFLNLVCYKDAEREMVFEGRIDGSIAETARGVAKHEKLPYDVLFIPKGGKHTYGEMKSEEKAKTSGRAMAFRKLAAWMVENEKLLEKARYKSNFENKLTIAVAALIQRDGKILLIKRKKEPAQGLWALPGGAIEFGETLEKALQREVKEELGVNISVGKLIHFTQNIHDKFHYITFRFSCALEKGAEPKNLEPEKHEKVEWFPVGKLPENTFKDARDAVEALEGKGVLE